MRRRRYRRKGEPNLERVWEVDTRDGIVTFHAANREEAMEFVSEMRRRRLDPRRAPRCIGWAPPRDAALTVVGSDDTQGELF